VTSRYHTTPDNTTDAHALNGDQESNVREGRRAPFKQLPDAVMDDDTISFTGKAVYWYLMRIASSGDHRGRVGISTIGAKIGVPAAWECVDELVKAGWLEITHKSLGARAELALDYVIHSEATPTCTCNGGVR